jgi:hypothetical protein
MHLEIPKDEISSIKTIEELKKIEEMVDDLEGSDAGGTK